MLKHISTKIASNIFGEENENIEIYTYGLELFFSSFFCSLLLLLLGLITNSIIESIVFMLSFSALRIFSGGYHANSYSLCTLITLIIYFLILLVYRGLAPMIQSNLVSLIIFALSLLVIFLFVPVSNTHKKIEKTKFKKMKFIASAVLVMEYAAYLILLNTFDFVPITIIVPTLISVDIMVFIPMVKGGIENVHTNQKGCR